MVVDEYGNVINDASDYWKKVYEQAEPKAAKYLHADGTIDENPGGGGGGADLEDNKEVKIDVSSYTEPVEITPTEGKDGMKKATVTLSNVPSTKVRLYGFEKIDGGNPYWACSNELVVGDLICGSDYEEYSLQNRYPVLEIKTVAELKTYSESFASALQGFNDSVKCYRVIMPEEGATDIPTNWMVLATDDPSFTPSEHFPAYIDMN